MDQKQVQQQITPQPAAITPSVVTAVNQNSKAQSSQVSTTQGANVSGVGNSQADNGSVSTQQSTVQVRKDENAVSDSMMSPTASGQPQPSQSFVGDDKSSSPTSQAGQQSGDGGLSSGIAEPEYPVGGDKERVELRGQMSEVAPVVEMNVDHEIEPEVEGWLEKLKTGEEIKIPDPIVDDQGDVILADAGAVVVEDKIVMPVTAEEYSVGLHKKMSDSARWLSEWVKRLMAQMGDGAVYRSTPSSKDKS